MKIKNIVQIAILAGLVTTGSIKPMAAVGAALRTAARWSLQKGGTIIGLGLPTYPYIKQTFQALHTLHTDPQGENTQTLMLH